MWKKRMIIWENNSVSCMQFYENLLKVCVCVAYVVIAKEAVVGVYHDISCILTMHLY